MHWSRPISTRAAQASASSTPIGGSAPSLSRIGSMPLFRLNREAPEAPALTLANTEDVMQLGARLDGVNLIVLDFPKFTDGRAYSQARLFRERLGEHGELRANGSVFLD